MVTVFIYCVCRYTYSTYSECTLHCGGGMQTRTVYCINERTSAMVDESHCIAQGLRKPTSQAACNQHPCAEYSAGPFGDVCNYFINIYLCMHTYLEDCSAGVAFFIYNIDCSVILLFLPVFSDVWRGTADAGGILCRWQRRASL